jgi:hypothetical protein
VAAQELTVPLTQQLEIEEAFALAAARLGVYEDHLAIAGLTVRLRFAGDRLRTRLLPALTHRITLPRDPDATILIYDCASAHIEKPAVPWRAEDVGARGEVFVDDALRVSLFAPSGALSVFDTSRNLGIFTVGDATGLPSYERAAPLRTLLHWVLESRDCRLAHAAAVATDRGGALLAGRGGSGKSTTALLCAIAGLRYGGDDYVGLTANPAIAHALYSSAKIDATSASMLREVALHIAPQENEKGVALLPDVADSFPIRALILPRVTGGISQLRRASGAEALRALAPTTVFQLPGNDGSTFAWMAAIAREVPAFALALGEDRERIPALVRRAIEESA